MNHSAIPVTKPRIKARKFSLTNSLLLLDGVTKVLGEGHWIYMEFRGTFCSANHKIKLMELKERTSAR